MMMSKILSNQIESLRKSNKNGKYVTLAERLSASHDAERAKYQIVETVNMIKNENPDVSLEIIEMYVQFEYIFTTVIIMRW